jgi:cell fate (sporulation/competence/biofilm development) regulator YlbF (YheA/YmcA/DUF963 family)
MQNVHDLAHQLADTIRQTEEYQTYMAAKAKASESAELSDAINDFHAKQFAMQQKQMAGTPPGSEDITQMQNLAQVLMRDPLAAEYLQAEVRFTLMVNDVYTILAEAVKTEM